MILIYILNAVPTKILNYSGSKLYNNKYPAPRPAMLPFLRNTLPWSSTAIYKKPEGYEIVAEAVLCNGLFLRFMGRVTDFDPTTGKVFTVDMPEGFISNLTFNKIQKEYSYMLTTEERVVFRFRHTLENLCNSCWYHVTKTRKGIIDLMLAQLP